MKKNLILIIIIFFTFSLSAYSQISAKDQENINRYKELYKTYKDDGNKSQMINYLIKIGFIYWRSSENQKAIANFEEALTYSKEINNTAALSTLYTYLGSIYTDIRKFDKAIQYSKENVNLAKQIGNKEQIVSANLNCANALQNGSQYKESIQYLKNALSIALELNNYKMLRKCYGQLATAYEKTGDAAKAKENFDYFTVFDRKIKDEEMKNVKATAQVQIAAANAQKKAKELENKVLNLEKQAALDSLNKAEEENRQKQIELDLLAREQEVKDLKLKEKEAQIRSERIILYSLIGVFVIVLIFMLALIKLFNDKRKANKLLEQKNVELTDKNEHIRIQNQELNKKNHQIEEQHTLLEKKNIQITDSINYASRIQRAILPSQRAIMKKFPESFIFYMPRDIVSGDFYWFTKHDNKVFLAAVDCTGHSVPGAFMSMIGNTLLNEIVNEKNVFEPAKILEHLNAGIIATLNQEVEEDEDSPDDGMDISLCQLDYVKKEITLAAANHYIFTVVDNKLDVVEGDIFSIGGQWSEFIDTEFTNNIIPMKKDMSIYMFSDGYADQFGGDEGRKFMIDRFQQLISDNCHLPMSEQWEVLNSTFTEWKKDHKQIDDILVIGIKLDKV